MAVKLSDTCKCEQKEWSVSSCGHHWCRRCGGYVDAVSRVCQKNPGPIIHCNRRPKWEDGYEYHFRDIMARDRNLTAQMRLGLTNEKTMRAYGLDRTKEDLATKAQYNVLKNEAKARTAFMNFDN